MVGNFSFSKVPEIYFGSGNLKKLPSLINDFEKTILIIKGKSSLEHSAYAYYKQLLDALSCQHIKLYEVALSKEPSPDFVDEVVDKYRQSNVDLVIGIGGGSVIDCGKAISAMLLTPGSVRQFLEGMETKKHTGRKVRYIAVPTSSGTGAEATKNAVLSEISENGFKRSLRHDNFVPNIALVDPMLTLTCPPEVTAACGLDALTQLIEGYVSTNASPYTDALALSGIEHFSAGFINSYEDGLCNLSSRESMSLAALTSGIVLANAGLGAVHGLAGSIGGLFNIPHGIVCGTLLGIVTKININGLLKEKELNNSYLNKYAKISTILTGGKNTNTPEACFQLIDIIDSLIEKTQIPKLGHYGVLNSDIEKIISSSSNKNNPIKLTTEQFKKVLIERI